VREKDLKKVQGTEISTKKNPDWYGVSKALRGGGSFHYAEEGDSGLQGRAIKKENIPKKA